MKKPLCTGIDHHVAWPGIEGDNSLHFSEMRAGWNDGEVGDTTNVLQNPQLAAMTKEGYVEQRNQRGAGSSSGHIRRSKIGDNRYLGARRNHRCFAGLPSGADAPSEKRRARLLVIEGLPMAADEIEFGDFVSLSRRVHRIRITFSQKKVEARQLGDGCSLRVHGCEYGLAHRARVVKMFMRNEIEMKASATATDANNRNIDAIRRCAAHHTRDNHALLAAAFCRTSSVKARRLRASTWMRSGSSSRVLVLRIARLDFLKRSTRSAARVTNSAKRRLRSASCSTAS